MPRSIDLIVNITIRDPKPGEIEGVEDEDCAGNIDGGGVPSELAQAIEDMLATADIIDEALAGSDLCIKVETVTVRPAARLNDNAE